MIIPHTKIDSLQHTVDSLKLTLHNYDPANLENRLQQASETISLLGTISSGFGVVFAILTILVTLVTIGVPFWINWNANNTIKKLENQFNLQIENLKTQDTLDTKNLNEKFDTNLNSFSNQIREEIEILNNIFADNLKEIDLKSSSSVSRLECNLFSLLGDLYFENRKFYSASQVKMIASSIAFDNKAPTLKRNLSQLFDCFEKLHKEHKLMLINYEFRNYKLLPFIQQLKTENLHLEIVIKLENLINNES